MSALQSFINANPVLAVVLIFGLGALVFLVVRIVLSSAGCLLRLIATIAIVVAIGLLLHMLSVR